MKLPAKPRQLPFLIPVLGALGFLLRLWLLSAANEVGLLPSGHFAGIALVLLSVVVLGALFLVCSTLGAGKLRYHRLFPASQRGAIGCLAGAVGILLEAIGLLTGDLNAMNILTGVCGVLAAVCLVLLSHFRLNGHRPTLLLRSAVCLFLMLRMVGQYHVWSAEPQVALYFCHLLASILLALSCFHRTTFDLGQGNRPLFVLLDLAAVYFCCLSVTGDGWIFYLTTGFWMYTELCTLRPLRKRPAAAKAEDAPRSEGE